MTTGGVPEQRPYDSSAWLWSQAFSTDLYHAIPAGDHDPMATGWIAKCGAFCCGKPIGEQTEEPCGKVCPKCLQAVCPARYGAYWLHPDGWYRLYPPNHPDSATKERNDSVVLRFSPLCYQ